MMAGFHDIIGHEMVKEHLQKAIEYHRVSHAYILSGEEGMGRKTLAKAFAMRSEERRVGKECRY